MMIAMCLQLEMVISACVGLGIVLVIMLIYCWKRNKK